MANDAVLNIDYAAWEKSLSDIGKRALPKAAQEVLNHAAFDARRELASKAEEMFDRPTKSTLSAFFVKKAHKSQGADMQSEVFIRQPQAQWLSLQVFGGTRRQGDWRTGPYDIALPPPGDAPRLSKYGALPKGMSRRLSREHKREQARRESGDSIARGIFFGEIDGLRGYWRRPKRTKAARHRQRGVRTVRNAGRPVLLLRFVDEAHFEPLFDFNRIVRDNYDHRTSEAMFREELARQLRYISGRNRTASSGGRSASSGQKPSWLP